MYLSASGGRSWEVSLSIRTLTKEASWLLHAGLLDSKAEGYHVLIRCQTLDKAIYALCPLNTTVTQGGRNYCYRSGDRGPER